MGLDQVAHELLDEEGVATGAPVELRREAGRRRCIEPCAGQGARLLLGQAGKRHSLQAPLAPQLAEQRAQLGIAAGAFVA